MGVNLLTVRVDDVVVMVHGAKDPTDAEWQEKVVALGREKPSAKTLVISDGGGPNAQQRALVTNEFGQIPNFRTAVVTTSRMARGVVTAISWFGVNIKSFTPEKTIAAFDFLDLAPTTRDKVIREVERLKAQLTA